MTGSDLKNRKAGSRRRALAACLLGFACALPAQAQSGALKPYPFPQSKASARMVKPAGPNPMLAFLPAGAKPDYAAWQSWMAQQAQHKRAALPSVDLNRLIVAGEVEPNDAQVTGVSLLPSPGKAELVIGVSGAVTVKDFALSNPSRIVLDLSGATLATAAEPIYDGVARAGVINVRVRQNAPAVVRVVLDLDRDRSYTVHREDGQVRVSFGADETFLAWSSGLPAAARSLPVAAQADASAAAPVRTASASLQAHIRRGCP